MPAIDYGRPLELPPRPGITYSAFVDASAGRHDAFCVCIGHKEEGIRFVADVVRGLEAALRSQRGGGGDRGAGQGLSVPQGGRRQLRRGGGCSRPSSTTGSATSARSS
ncbi:MAG: hypothetical protein WDN31_05280 [Hyphomicrobium sp.]